jgi:L-ascorbate metabolism protein UlaG (beta-lactamase superfamily)
MIGAVLFSVFLIGIVVVLVSQPVVGGIPRGNRLERIRKSQQYRQGAFRNQSPTPVQSKEFSIIRLLKAQFNPPSDKEPSHPVPFVQTDLNQSSIHPMIVWFGHSSYFITINTIRILVDPVLSGHAAPIKIFGKSFPGTNFYTAERMPALDAVLITHDHYDHLDHETILKLNEKVGHYYTSLGVGAHLERWGIKPDKITELDWNEHASLPGGLELIAVPARHFSGRSFRRNNTLWSSFILKSDQMRLYLGGDSGYNHHFKSIGEQYGPFDMALLECGQYNTMWPLIHMMPEETVQAALDLNAKVLMPVHWGKFSLALHSWKEPINRLLEAADNKPVIVTTPMIGEPVVLDQLVPQNRWWESL